VSDATHRYVVVVPGFNEERWIGQTLDALAAQTEQDFAVVVVDNASTDGTAQVVRDAFGRHPHLHGTLLHEPEKGTGCAADTGFRHAIAQGAEIVFRTDADCLPTPTWFAELKRLMVDRELDAAGGRLRIRTDDVDLGFTQLWISRLGAALVRRIGPFLKTNRGPDYVAPYVMLPGPNVAIRASAYEACGGYPRRSFDGAFLDKDIANALRRTTPKIRYAPKAVVMFSERRTKAYGTVGTIKWLLKREGHDGVRDVR